MFLPSQGNGISNLSPVLYRAKYIYAFRLFVSRICDSVTTCQMLCWGPVERKQVSQMDSDRLNYVDSVCHDSTADNGYVQGLV